jgi:hypothetical protein
MIARLCKDFKTCKLFNSRTQNGCVYFHKLKYEYYKFGNPEFRCNDTNTIVHFISIPYISYLIWKANERIRNKKIL